MKNKNNVEKMIILEKLNNINVDLTDLIDYSQNTKDFILISEFTYKGFACTFFKDNNRFIFTYEKNNYAEVLIFNSFEELLCNLIKNKLKKQKQGKEYL